MNRGGHFKVPQKATNFWGTLKRLISYLNKDAYVMIISALLASIAALLSVFTPFVAGKVLTSLTEIWLGNSGVISVVPGFEMDFYGLLILTLGSALLTSVLNYTQGYILIGITQKLT